MRNACELIFEEDIGIKQAKGVGQGGAKRIVQAGGTACTKVLEREGGCMFEELRNTQKAGDS